MSMRKEKLFCLGCSNESFLIYNTLEVEDSVEYCPFCGASLQDTRDELATFDENDDEIE